VVTNVQLYIAVGIPLLFNATLIGVLITYINAKFAAVAEKFKAIDEKFLTYDEKFNGINARLDHLHEMWRTELRRVEQILDLRLKHLEPR
jgi:hypothetical protein